MHFSEKEIFGLLSTIPGVIGFGIYIWSAFKKGTKPHTFTWIIWAIINAVVFAAQWSKNAGAGSWTTGFTFIACSIVAIVSLFRGDKHITTGDKIAFAGGLATIPLWYFTKDPLWSVILACAVDGFALYPTIRKSWRKPHEESVPQYILDSGRLLISFLAMENITLTSILYPLCVIIIDTAFALTLLLRRTFLRRKR
jgi:chromate transport protein ChrA